MTSALNLRAWQAAFCDRLAAHQGYDFLLVACPAAGKTIAAGAAISAVMTARGCDQVVVVAPTVLVRDQWATELDELGYRMQTSIDRVGAWPPHVHGACVTYAQVAYRAAAFADACAARGTVVIFDEIHHAGSQLSWGTGIAKAFAGARLRLMLSGTPFRSDHDRIPFVTYDDDGTCTPDFSYDYPTAVADGACRSVRFHAHDGLISWRHESGERAARFTDTVPPEDRPRRLRASLDPTRPYLRSLLEAADRDLEQLRGIVPDAAGLVVCDSQAHALQIDRLITEITGHLPILAISDIPRAHEAIKAFGQDDDRWLISVRMVAEGVDIPRLGVIAWATAARTELMVRQVAGRALRGRSDYAGIPATIHIPADPDLMRYAARLDVLGGIEARAHHHTADAAPRSSGTFQASPAACGCDPGPFLAWFDQQAAGATAAEVLNRCGWTYDAGMRMLHRWRVERARADILKLVDACHLAGIDFDTLYDGDEHQAARAFAADPYEAGEGTDFHTIDAQHAGMLEQITPPLPTVVRPRPAVATEIHTPQLPPSPAEIKAAEEAREAARGEVMNLLGVYTALRSAGEPAFQLATAHRELALAVGLITKTSTAAELERALHWLRTQASALARANPHLVKDIARQRRRLGLVAA